MRRLFAILLSLALPMSAQAARTKIAVLPVDLDHGAKREVPDLVNDIVLSAVQDLGTFEVIGHDDVNTLLGFEQQKEMLGCDDATCMAQIGGALGVDKLLALRVARLQGDWVVTGKLIDIKSARVEDRFSDFVRGSARELLQALPGLVGVLFGKKRAPPPPDQERVRREAELRRQEQERSRRDAEIRRQLERERAALEEQRRRLAEAERAAKEARRRAAANTQPPPAKKSASSASSSLPEMVMGFNLALGLNVDDDRTSYGFLFLLEYWFMEYLAAGMLMDFEVSGDCDKRFQYFNGIQGGSCPSDTWLGAALYVGTGLDVAGFLKLHARLALGVSKLMEGAALLLYDFTEPGLGLYATALAGFTIWFGAAGLEVTTGLTRWSASWEDDVPPGLPELAPLELRLNVGLNVGF